MRITLYAGLLIFALLGLYLGAAVPQTPATPKTRVNPKDGAQMVWVPAGAFLMGSTDADIAQLVKERPNVKASLFSDEQPRHTVHLDGYWIYQYEVTVAQFRAFCQAAGREMPKQPDWSTDRHPVVNVTWFDAAAYAQWAGARLPTEAQWEKAARGTDGRRFSWGNDWDVEKCNNFSDSHPAGGGVHGKRATPGGTYVACASPYGAQDMAGNVWEWCEDYYAKDYYAASPAKNPTGPAEGEFRVLRGGAWGSSRITVRTTCRHRDAPDVTYHDDGGFRCVVVPVGKP